MALTKQISSRALILSPSTAEVTTAQTIAPYYDFRLSGVLELPIEGFYDGGRYINADQTFITAKISVRKGGTSEYDISVRSYDASGGDEIIHINLVGMQFTADNAITTLSFLDNTIGAERTLTFHIVESTAGTPVEDFTLTLTSSLFADLNALDAVPVQTMTGPALTNTQAFILTSDKAVAITPTGVDYADASVPSTAEACIGIMIASAAPGGPINLASAGLAQNVLTGMGFTAGDEIFLGVAGALVNSATASAFPPGYALKQLGFALNATDMWVQIADAEIII